MAGILIHDVSGYPGEEYNLKIPSLTDTANIQEAMMLFHYGIDNYDGTGEPAAQSVFGNLKDFDDRIASLEESEVVALSGTANQIAASGSVGTVTVSLPNSIITPGTLSTTSHLSIGGSASFTGNVSLSGNQSTSGSASITGNATVGGTLVVTGAADVDSNLTVGSGSANFLNVTGSGSFTRQLNALRGINIFVDSTARDAAITSPTAGVEVYLTGASAGYVYNGATWVESVSATSTTTLTNKTLTTPLINAGILASPEERISISSTSASGTTNIDLISTTVKNFTSNAAANWSFNFRGDGSTTLNSILATGDAITCAIMVPQGTTAYYPTAVTVDGNALTPKYQGGDAPSAGNASSTDVYSYTIIKTGDATFSVFGSQSQFK
jgi:hypothetical protein